MSTVSVKSGDLVVLDPGESRIIQFDWDAENLATSVTINTSTFTISAITQGGATALTKDNPSILTGSRKTQVRVIATTATEGDLYWLTNTILTGENPTQTKEQSIKILVQNK